MSRHRSNSVENKMIRNLDLLAQFEQYSEQVHPLLREAVEKGWTAEQIWAHPKLQAMLAARTITIGLTDKDTSRALAAIKEFTDRAKGKSTERKEIAHKLEKLPDSQLDALIKSRLREATCDDDQDDE